MLPPKVEVGGGSPQTNIQQYRGYGQNYTHMLVSSDFRALSESKLPSEVARSFHTKPVGAQREGFDCLTTSTCRLWTNTTGVTEPFSPTITPTTHDRHAKKDAAPSVCDILRHRHFTGAFKQMTCLLAR